MKNPMSTYPSHDLHHAVAAQFASRPTLRQVAGEQAMRVIREHYPLVGVHRPELTTAQSLHVLYQTPDRQLRHEPLIDLLLRSMLDATPLDFAAQGAYAFSLKPLTRFFAIKDPHATAEGDLVKPAELSEAFNEMLALMPYHFQQAQIGYWNGSTDIDRDAWLQQVLRASLMQGLSDLPSAGDERQRLRNLIMGNPAGLKVQAVRVQMHQGERTVSELLPWLLVTTDENEWASILWCSPDGEVRHFASRKAFAQALQLQMAERYSFASLSWNTFTAQGDAFSLQSSLVLEILLQRIDRIRISDIQTVAELEQAYERSCQPALFFTGRIISPIAPVQLSLPKSLKRAEPDAQTAYLQAMLDLSALQGGSDGSQSLDGIEDLHTYTSRRLREELIHDYPHEANYFSDDLLLTVDTFVSDGHSQGLGFAQKIDSKTVTLTELAIGRLDATAGGVVTHIAHRDNQLIMDWMNVNYVHQLVNRVNIGGNYPAYINQRLADQTERPARIARFARQWRTTLMFDAARAVVVKRLDKRAYAALARFCRGYSDHLAEIRIAPLTFKRSPTSAVVDICHGFYVIEIVESASHLLYCPLYTNDAVHQFQDAEALMQAIREPGKLQDKALMWLEQSQRAVYDNGGFKEPHLPPHWVFDPFAPLDKPKPAALSLAFWTSEVDAQMFDAKHQLMKELANHEAPSNAALRWGVVTAFAWELLNITLPILPGPLVSVSWLYLGMKGLVSDVDGLSKGDTNDKVLAITDILNNTLMALIHAQLPKLGSAQASADYLPQDLSASGEATGLEPLPAPEQQQTETIDQLQSSAGTHLDFSWRGAAGLNALSAEQRSRLRGLAAHFHLRGTKPIEQGPSAGLKRLGGKLYVELAGDVYEVQDNDDGFRIIGTEQTPGPWLFNDGNGWRVDTRLQGGGGRLKARERLRQKLESSIESTLTDFTQCLNKANEVVTEYLKLNNEVNETQRKIAVVDTHLNATPPTDPDKLHQFNQAAELFNRKHGQLLGELAGQRRARIEKLRVIFDNYLQAENLVVKLLDNPSYQRTTTLQAEQRQTLAQIRTNLIGYGMYLVEEQLGVGDFRAYDPLVQQLKNALPEQKPALYERYTRMLDSMTQDQRLIIDVSSQLDRLLAVSDLDIQVTINETPMTINQIIQQRKATTVAIRFFQAMINVELVLHSLEGTKTQHYAIFRDALAGKRLSVAANTHQLSLFCDLPLSDRIEVLQTAWDEYLAAILNCDRISKLGNQLIDTQRLQAYREQIVLLKEHTGEALVKAMREQAAGQSQTSLRAVYPTRPVQVAHTRSGQIVIGTEVVVDAEAELQVQATFSNEVVYTFRRNNGVWEEQIAAPQPAPEQQSRSSTPESERNSKALAEGILEHNENVIDQARELVASDGDDRGLAAMLDGQISEVQELREQLAHSENASDLLTRLDDAERRLQDVKQQCLVELYSKTRYPGARALNFLHQQKLIKVEYVSPRKQVSDGYLDEYRIELLDAPGDAKGKPLWAAHFHYAESQAAPTAFGKGHLKLWSQRKKGYRDQIKAAEAGQVLNIYRGNLTYDQAKGAIPFNQY